jgi:hypothetical protein
MLRKLLEFRTLPPVCRAPFSALEDWARPLRYIMRITELCLLNNLLELLLVKATSRSTSLHRHVGSLSIGLRLTGTGL